LSRSFCPSFGGEGGFLFIKKKDAKKIQYWFARLFTISTLGDCLFVILRAFIELEQTLFWSVDEAALLKGKSELER